MSNTNKITYTRNWKRTGNRSAADVKEADKGSYGAQLLKSPYNFVELNEEVFDAYLSLEELPDPGRQERNLLTGEITYRITAETPLVFEHGIKNLTSSMVRGLIRSNLQILGFSSVYDDITDVQNRYRDFRNNYYRELMTETNLPGRQKDPKINAGIIFRNAEGVFIRPGTAFGGTGFCRLNLERIQRTHLDWRNNYNVSFEGVKNVFDTLSEGISSRRTQIRSKNIRKAFIKKVSWRPGPRFGVDGVGEEGRYENSGWLVNPGYIYSSKSYYLIPCESNAGEPDLIRLTSEETAAYNDYVSRQSIKDASGRRSGFYDLPAMNSEKPVFYILHDGKCEFGFTKQFPISWKYSIRKGIPAQHSEMKIDYAMALFGFNGVRCGNTGREASYGGRLTFMPPIKKKQSSDLTAELLLAMPGTASYRCYIHDDEGEGYNSEKFRVNGIKQYWLQKDTAGLKVSSRNAAHVTGDDAGTVYEGMIRFYNLRDDELGLLLWSIGLNKGCRQNIGAGKPYGYGRIAVEILEVRQIHYHLCHFQTGPFPDPEQQTLDPESYIRIYQDRLNHFLKGNLEKNQRLQNFFIMKDMNLIPDPALLSYENLKGGRFEKLSFPKISDLARSQTWLILQYKDIEDLNDISWNEFAVKPPAILGKMHPEKDIYDAYRELAETLDLFECNRSYYVRQDILLEYMSLSDRIRKLLKEKEAGRSLPNMSSEYQMIERNMEICISEIKMLIKKMEEAKKRFEQEGIPVLQTEIVRSSRIESNECEIVLRMTIPESSSLIRVNSICFMEGESCRFIDKEKFFVADGEPCEHIVRISLYDGESEQSSYLQMDMKIEYQFIRETKPVKRLFESQIEVSLLSGDYQELKNPYSSWLGNPVSEKDMFFGRDKLLKDILQKIESCSSDSPSGRNIIIYGQKRTGKSTFLYFLKQALQADEENRYVVIDIGNVGSAVQVESGENQAGRAGLRQFFRRMIDQAEDELCENFESLYDQLQEEDFEFPYLGNASDAEAMDLCEQFYKKLSSRLMPDQRIVLLIDEFTYFYDMIVKEYMDQNFMQFWKAFIQNTKICAVLVGQDYMEDFRNRFANEFGASDFIRLTYLDKASAREMICRPFLKDNGYDGFTEGCVEEILRLTAGSAYYVMYICSGLVSYLNEKRTGKMITHSVLKEFLWKRWLNTDSGQRISRAFFESLFNDGMYPEWDDDNLVILHEIALLDKREGASRDEVIGRIRNTVEFAIEKTQRLVSREVLSERQGKLCIRVGLFREWLLEVY